MEKNKKAFKILVTGSFGSGKTTLVKTLSEIEPLLTERKITSYAEKGENKKTTTVALDMGKLKISDGLEIHLFGAPGQERFDFMLDILQKGIIGAIVLVDATNPSSVEIAMNIANKLTSQLDIPIAFAITKGDLVENGAVEGIKNMLSVFEGAIIESIDPRDKSQGKELLLKLLSQIMV